MSWDEIVPSDKIPPFIIPNDGQFPVGRCVQKVTFLIPKTVCNGETVHFQIPYDSEGNLIEGDFLATIDKDNNVKIIGNG